MTLSVDIKRATPPSVYWRSSSKISPLRGTEGRRAGPVMSSHLISKLERPWRMEPEFSSTWCNVDSEDMMLRNFKWYLIYVKLIQNTIREQATLRLSLALRCCHCSFEIWDTTCSLNTNALRMIRSFLTLHRLWSKINTNWRENHFRVQPFGIAFLVNKRQYWLAYLAKLTLLVAQDESHYWIWLCV